MHAQAVLWFASKRKVYKRKTRKKIGCFLWTTLLLFTLVIFPLFLYLQLSFFFFQNSFPLFLMHFVLLLWCETRKRKLRSILKIALAFWMIACIEEVLMDWIDFEEKNHPIQSFWLCWFIIDNECRIVPKTNKTSNLQCRINLDRTQKYDSIWFLYSFTYKQKGEDFME